MYTLAIAQYGYFESTMKAAMKAKEAGKAHFIGVSGHKVQKLFALLSMPESMTWCC